MNHVYFKFIHCKDCVEAWHKDEFFGKFVTESDAIVYMIMNSPLFVLERELK
jgi:hypothetical protein